MLALCRLEGKIASQMIRNYQCVYGRAWSSSWFVCWSHVANPSWRAVYFCCLNSAVECVGRAVLLYVNGCVEEIRVCSRWSILYQQVDRESIFSFRCLCLQVWEGRSHPLQFIFEVLLLICLLCMFFQLPNSLFMLIILPQQQYKTVPQRTFCYINMQLF